MRVYTTMLLCLIPLASAASPSLEQSPDVRAYATSVVLPEMHEYCAGTYVAGKVDAAISQWRGDNRDAVVRGRAEVRAQLASDAEFAEVEAAVLKQWVDTLPWMEEMSSSELTEVCTNFVEVLRSNR